MKILNNYQNGDFTCTLYDDGTFIKESTVPNPQAAFPSTIDVKITDYCNLGCAWCHENSTLKGVHGNLSLLAEQLFVLPAGIEIACLEENTSVFTPNGLVKIKNLKIGDYVYDENCIPVKITDILENYKDCIELSFNKGNYLKIISTEDHIFLDSDKKQIYAKDLVGKNLLISNFKSFTDKTLDMSEFITKKSISTKSRSGSITDTTVRLYHNAKEIDRYIIPDKDLMYLYGISVAEGSHKGIALNISEKDIASKVMSIYRNKFNLDSRIYEHIERNSLSVEFSSPEIYSRIFFEAMQIGYGACNKSIKFLFGLNIELVREALYAMFLGDGCFRKRLHKNGRTYYSLSYKTCSETLIQELQYILYTYFNVHSSTTTGINSLRYIEARRLDESKYFMLDVYGKNNISKLFPNLYTSDKEFNSTVKYSNSKTSDLKCTAIQKIGRKRVFDISLEEKSSHLFTLANGIVTHNCGGGNPLDHPSLLEFLYTMQERGIHCNITINQGHIETYKSLIQEILNNNLVKGIGISITGNTSIPFWLLDAAGDNLVLHMIIGVHTVNQLRTMLRLIQKPKILLLGYKSQVGRGVEYYSPTVEKNIRSWFIYIRSFFGKCVLSFDNLAIEQLQLQRFFSMEAWSRFYMGDDFTSSMYIDAVKQQYAPTSRSLPEQRTSYTNLLEYWEQTHGNIT